MARRGREWSRGSWKPKETWGRVVMGAPWSVAMRKSKRSNLTESILAIRKPACGWGYDVITMITIPENGAAVNGWGWDL